MRLLVVHRRSAPESVIGFDSSCKLASRSPAACLGAAVWLDSILREAAGCERRWIFLRERLAAASTPLDDAAAWKP
jgi:hypothetical protein